MTTGRRERSDRCVLRPAVGALGVGLLGAFCGVAAAGAAQAPGAAEAPAPSPLHALVVQSPELVIREAALPSADLQTASGRSALEALEALGVRSDAAFVDPRSGRWATLMPSTPLLPGAGNDLRWGEGLPERPRDAGAMRQHAWNAFAAWFTEHADDLGIDPAEVAAPGQVTVLRGGDLVHLVGSRRVGGLPVRGSRLTAVISHGNLVLFGAVRWGTVRPGAIERPDAPRLDATAARQVIDRHLGALAGRVAWRRHELVVLPVARGDDPRTGARGEGSAPGDGSAGDEGYGHRVAWSFRGTSPGEVTSWEALVDADDGSLLAFTDETLYAAPRAVVGGAYPVSNDGDLPDGVEGVAGMPFARVGTPDGVVVTDRGGQLGTCVDGTITTALDGLHVLVDDQCGALSESTTDDVLDLGLAVGTDCGVAAGASAGNTPAARTAFVELNRIMAIGRGYLPGSPYLSSQVTARTNFPFTCGASAAGGLVTTGRRMTSDCANAGENAGVLDHEWGHSFDLLDASVGVSDPAEGIADLYAALALHSSCIGRGFRVAGTQCSGYGDPCTQCDGVRDIDWALRAGGQPHTVAWADANCGSSPSNAGPCGGSDHCEGAVASEAVWDLWHRDLPAAPYGYGPRRSAALTALLTWHGAIHVDRWFTCAQAASGDGCHADGGYLNFLAADDDDGDLTNGTPHMGAIFAAFDRHGIACTSPAVQDAGCAGTPTAAPTVAATPLARGAELTWDPVAGASAYRVFRTEGVNGCDFGKELVGEVTALRFVDRGLRPGADVHYTVIPRGPSTTCYGPASECVTVQPTAAGAALSLPPQEPQVLVETGDGDLFVDSCETATVSFPVENLGDTATGVRLVGVRALSHPHLEQAVSIPPQITPTLAPCEQTTGRFRFVAFAVDHDDTILFEVDVTSDQLTPQVVSRTYAIRFVESDWRAFASATFGFETGLDGWTVAEGLFTRTDAFGGGQATTFALASSNGVASACDRVRSPLFVPSASSRISLWTEMDMEPPDWDRANVAVVPVAGERAVLAPDGGRGYDVAGNPDFDGCNAGEPGWGGTQAWLGSDWSPGVFTTSGHVGELVQLEITHATDAATTGTGFRVDQITLTGLDLQIPDTQPDCVTLLLFADGFESGDTSAWSLP